MGFKDLREYLQELENIGELIKVREEVDWNLEAGAIMRRCNERQGPVPLFENIKDYPGYRMTSDLLSTFGRFAVAFGLPHNSRYEAIVDEYTTRSGQLIKPQLINTGACKENILLGDKADLLKLPVPMVHAGDGGRYIGTLHVAVMKDPESNWINWGIYRIMVHDGRSAGLFMQPNQHGALIYRKHEQMNKPMEFASFMGSDPLVYLGAATSFPYGVSEVDVVGGLRKEPVQLVRCETVDLQVPASSEIVIEGEVLPNIRKDEGPFGEYTGYQTREAFPRPILKIKAITFRNNPILTVDVEGTPVVMDHIVGSVTRSAEIKKGLVSAGLPVTGVYVPPEATNHMIVISTKRTAYPIAFKIAAFVWAGKPGHSIPHVFVVDDDVDPTNMSEVIHAFATKCHPSRGITVIHHSHGNQLTPFLNSDERKMSKGSLALYDCTWPVEWDPRDIPVKSSFRTIYPKEIQEKVLAKWNRYGFRD